METALRRMGEMLASTVDAIGGWFERGVAVPLLEPAAWPAGLWLLLVVFVVLLVVASVRRSTRSPLVVRSPEILVTQAELVPASRTGRVGAGDLQMTVTNLGRYPVQLLEAASATGGGGRFGVAEIVALVPPMAEVELAVRLPVGKLEDGVLDLYCYAAATRTKVWRHRAELIWEPWARRFKVSPLEQRIEPVRALASSRRDVVRMDDVKRIEDEAARQAEVTTRHTDPGVRRTDSGARRGAAERQGRLRDVPPREARGAPGGRPGSLVALLGSSRTRPVQLPPEHGGGGLGASARAARSSRAASPEGSRPADARATSGGRIEALPADARSLNAEDRDEARAARPERPAPSGPPGPVPAAQPSTAAVPAARAAAVPAARAAAVPAARSAAVPAARSAAVPAAPETASGTAQSHTQPTRIQRAAIERSDANRSDANRSYANRSDVRPPSARPEVEREPTRAAPGAPVPARGARASATDTGPPPALPLRAGGPSPIRPPTIPRTATTTRASSSRPAGGLEAGTSAAPRSAAPRAPDAGAPAPPRPANQTEAGRTGRDVAPRPKPERQVAEPASGLARRARARAPAPTRTERELDDPDEPRAPRRPPNLTLEFPDEF